MAIADRLFGTVKMYVIYPKSRKQSLDTHAQKFPDWWEILSAARGPWLAAVSTRLAFEIMAANSFYCQSSQNENRSISDNTGLKNMF